VEVVTDGDRIRQARVLLPGVKRSRWTWDNRQWKKCGSELTNQSNEVVVQRAQSRLKAGKPLRCEG